VTCNFNCGVETGGGGFSRSQTVMYTVKVVVSQREREGERERERERVYLPQNRKKNIQNHSKYNNSGRLPDR